MSSIQIDESHSRRTIYKYSDILCEINHLSVNEDIDQSNTSFSPLLTGQYGFYFSPLSWKTVTLDNKSYFLPRGAVFLVKPGQILTIESSPEKGGQTFFLILNAVPPNLSDQKNLGYSESERVMLFECMLKRDSPVLLVSSQVGRICDQINQQSLNIIRKGADLLACLKLKNLFRELWIFLAEGEELMSNMLDSRIDSLLPRLPKGGYSSLVDNAINQMGDNLTGNLTLVHLADKANISLSRFKVRFKEETEISPLEYYTRLSIQRAMLLLHETDMTITEIAETLGYSSPGYFSTVFKNTAGLTPGEMRRIKEKN